MLSVLDEHPIVALSGGRASAATDVPGACFDVMCRREFTYLSRSKALRYRNSVTSSLSDDVTSGSRLSFYLDIGGGYHAGIDPARRKLRFKPGLGELLLLRQIVRFDSVVREIYPRGVEFKLVVDNLCARYVNDVPLDDTLSYCTELRRLIAHFDLGDTIKVLVESEEFDPQSYEARVVPTAPTALPSPSEIENVARFLGRPCSAAEAAERIARYRSIGELSETNFDGIVSGVRMTQRATEHTFGFRAFPGSDSRIQAGEVVLVELENGRVVPRLWTSRTGGSGELCSYLISRPIDLKVLFHPG